MTMPVDVFCEIPCLTEQSKQLNGISLLKKWFKKADSRYINQYLQKFINYNSLQFKFLNVHPFISGIDKKVSLFFSTSNYIGVIPLRAGDTGKQIGDFVVTPRFIEQDRFENYIEILELLGDEINPEIMDSLPLASGRNFRPPLYLEAFKFITSLENLCMKPWCKFDSKEKISIQPFGQINWNKYINNEYKVEKRLLFPTRKNILSEFHEEYEEIRYVFDICKKELLSFNTPPRIKNSFRKKLGFLEEKMYFHKPKVTDCLIIKFADNPLVKACKEQANRVLNFNFISSTAWRVDFSDVFEKFIQYIFKEVSKEIGGKVFVNYKFYSRTSKHYSWELKHVEPDVIYQKESMLVFIDAKYKSNLYNKYSFSDFLKEDFRRDLHQIMAYSSFNKAETKFNFLCYPSDQLEIKSLSYFSNINETTNTVSVVGIPLTKNSIPKAKKMLAGELEKIMNRKLSVLSNT